MSSNLLSKNVKIKVYRTTVLPVVLMGVKLGCSQWEERSLRMLENRVLRGIFRPKRNEVTEEWRKLDIEELNYLFSSPN